MKQRRPDDVIRCSADADPMSKTIIGPMKLSVIGPMKHTSRARHRADEVVLVGIQPWSPYLRKDIDMVDKIQRRATKLIPGLRDLRCEERLKECGLTTLETRRLRGDQIEVFKIINGYETFDCTIFYEIKESKITRGHNFTLVKKQK